MDGKLGLEASVLISRWQGTNLGVILGNWSQDGKWQSWGLNTDRHGSKAPAHLLGQWTLSCWVLACLTYHINVRAVPVEDTSGLAY